MKNADEEALISFNEAIKLVEIEYQDLPDGIELVKKITLRLENAFNNPPIEAMETILQKRFSCDQARITLFRPLQDQIVYYPILLQATTNVPSDHPFEKLRALLISLIYLSHRKSWSFLEEFIVSGGLNALVPLLSDKNLYLRGQTMEILMNITDCDTFDWFKVIENKNSREYLLHIRLLQLAEHPEFLKHLLSNRTNSYPGGSFRALQMLAFWMSWVRAIYTENQKLELSQRVLDELYLWSTVPAEDKSEEEMKLAQTVYDDFSGQSKERIVSEISIEEKEQLFISGFSYSVPNTETVQLNDKKENNQKPLIDNASINEESKVSILDQINGLKIKANELYKQQNYEYSLDLYTEALDLIHDHEHTEDVSSIEVTLHFNRAASLWMISKKLRDGKVSTEGIDDDDDDNTNAIDCDSPGTYELLRCEQACKAALSIHKNHVKSAYRLANVLLLLGKVDESLQMIEEVIESLTKSPQSVSNDNEVSDIDEQNDKIKILKKIRTKCLAALIVRNDSIESTQVESIIGTKTAKILNQLKSRNKRENEGIQHPWNGTWVPPETDDYTMNKIESHDNNNFNNIDDVYNDMIKNENDDKKKTKKTTKKTTKASDLITSKTSKMNNKKSLDCFNKLKKLSQSFELGKDQVNLIKQSKSILLDIWDQNMKINEIIDCSLEENILIFMFHLIHDEIEDVSFSNKLMNEIMNCQRIESQIRLALHGNDTLKLAITKILQIIPDKKLQSLVSF